MRRDPGVLVIQGETRLVTSPELAGQEYVTSPDGWTADPAAFVGIKAVGQPLDDLQGGEMQERAQAWPLADVPGLIEALTQLRDVAIEDGLLRRAT